MLRSQLLSVGLALGAALLVSAASIGLETKFRDLAGAHEGSPALAFVGAQAFNILVTLLLAYAFFGGQLFPVPSFK